MCHHRRRLILFLALLGTGLVLLVATSVTFAQDDEPQPTEPAADNSYCAICHSQPGRTMPLQDGSVLDLYVSPAVIADSVHGATDDHPGLGCVDCHGNNVFPHSGPSPESARAYRIQASQLCSNCHNEVLADSAHLEAIAAGDLRAATCVDCHRAHDVAATEDQPALVSAVCGDCHTTTYAEWAESPHASMESLGCEVCHLPHGQQLRIEDTTALCMNCHNVPGDIYVHAKHLESEYDVSCASCHMAFDPTIQPMSGSEEPTDHHMVVATRSCNECHEELEANGTWAQVTDTNQEVMIERDALRQQVANLETELSARGGSEDSESDENYVRLIQGLIVGLGIGMVLVLILVPRFMRSSNGNTTVDENDESE
jgi:hypothetical protein